jgi:hypothetical protein
MICDASVRGSSGSPWRSFEASEVPNFEEKRRDAVTQTMPADVESTAAQVHDARRVP